MRTIVGGADRVYDITMYKVNVSFCFRKWRIYLDPDPISEQETINHL